MKNEFLWVEKYRPKTIKECILPDSHKRVFQKIVDSGEMHNMLLTGTAGLGKTTVARALCNELNLEYLLINSSPVRFFGIFDGKGLQSRYSG